MENVGSTVTLLEKAQLLNLKVFVDVISIVTIFLHTMKILVNCSVKWIVHYGVVLLLHIIMVFLNVNVTRIFTSMLMVELGSMVILHKYFLGTLSKVYHNTKI
jgi:hypothetical protein